MTKFLVIYTSPVSAREQMLTATPEQAKAGMQAWMAWSQKAGSAIVDMGNPLGSSARMEKHGPVAANSTIGGFSIMQAESRDELMKLLVEHPHFMVTGATIEVHEFLPMPGL